MEGLVIARSVPAAGVDYTDLVISPVSMQMLGRNCPASMNCKSISQVRALNPTPLCSGPLSFSFHRCRKYFEQDTLPHSESCDLVHAIFPSTVFTARLWER